MNWQQHLDKAFQSYQLGNYQQAAKDYERAVAAMQSSRDAGEIIRLRTLVQLGYCHLFLGAATEATHAFEQCPAQIEEYDIQIRRTVGTAMISVLRNDIDKALRAVKQIPSYSDLKSTIANLVPSPIARNRAFADLCKALALDYGQHGNSEQSAQFYELAFQAYSKSVGPDSVEATECAAKKPRNVSVEFAEGWQCECGESNDLHSKRCLRCYKVAPFISLCSKCGGTTEECNCWRVENNDTGGYMFS